ncbi:hypothetical protein ACFWJM_06585 [Streptomyces sp. NPDC127077]
MPGFKDTMVRAGQSRQRDVAAGLDDMVRAERAKQRDDDPAHHKEEPTGS